jgi:hypothetical protein
VSCCSTWTTKVNMLLRPTQQTFDTDDEQEAYVAAQRTPAHRRLRLALFLDTAHDRARATAGLPADASP